MDFYETYQLGSFNQSKQSWNAYLESRKKNQNAPLCNTNYLNGGNI